MKAYEKIGIHFYQSHCSIVPENTALLFPNLLHFIFPKSLYFFFLFTAGSANKLEISSKGVCSVLLRYGPSGSTSAEDGWLHVTKANVWFVG